MTFFEENIWEKISHEFFWSDALSEATLTVFAVTVVLVKSVLTVSTLSNFCMDSPLGLPARLHYWAASENVLCDLGWAATAVCNGTYGGNERWQYFDWWKNFRYWAGFVLLSCKWWGSRSSCGALCLRQIKDCLSTLVACFLLAQRCVFAEGVGNRGSAAV